METDPPPGSQERFTEAGGQHHKLPDIAAMVDAATDIASCFEDGSALIAQAFIELIENASLIAKAATNLTTAMDQAKQDKDVIEATAELTKARIDILGSQLASTQEFISKIMNTMGERVRRQKVR